MQRSNDYRPASYLRRQVKIMLGLPFLFLLPLLRAGAQSPDDLRLVKETRFYSAQQEKYYQRAGNSDSTLRTHSKSVVAAYNPVSLLMKGSMFLYQHVLTQQLSRSCPYEITCSNFSKHAIHELGLVKGVLVSADRIMRCNRISLLDVSPLDKNERTGTISDDVNRYQ